MTLNYFEFVMNYIEITMSSMEFIIKSLKSECTRDYLHFFGILRELIEIRDEFYGIHYEELAIHN